MPVEFCVLIRCTAHVLWAAEGTQTLLKKTYYHYVVCNAFQSKADLMKSEKYASFATAILIL